MKKVNLILISMVITASSVYGGGLVTNTNQSAAWARTLTREASLGVDAVYYNPAGLSHLKNGLSLSLSNQTIFQTRNISTTFPMFNNAPESTYEAELTAPIFPSIYAAYKMDKWTFSAGFNIIGGGGTADFEEGLPSIEMSMLALAPTVGAILTPVDQIVEDITTENPGFANVSGYDMDAAFSGSSQYMGFQAGATYAINDMLSVAIVARYVSVKNVYDGSLEAKIYAPVAYGGELIYPGDYLRMVGTQVPNAAETLNGYADLLDVPTKDATVDVVQKGSGFTPIIGVNLHLSDMINIAAKYEHHTKIELSNETANDDVDMFPPDAKSRADLPGMFSLGAQVKPINKLTASVGFNYYLDKPAYYGNPELDDTGAPVMDEDGVSYVQANNEATIDENAYTISASLEYKLLGILGLSAGFSTGNLGVNDDYQSDMSYALKSSTVAGGVFVDVGEIVTINAGVVYVMYDDYTKNFTEPAPYADTFGKNTTIIAIGVDISL